MPQSAPGSRTEQRGADPDQGRAGLDRRLEIVGHAQRQRVDAGGARGECVEQGAHPIKSGPARGRPIVGRRNCHQTAQRKLRMVENEVGQSIDLLGRTAGLLRLGVDVDLNQDIEWRTLCGSLFGEAAYEFFPVNALNPIEQGGDALGLVRLQWANEMPLQRQIGQLGCLGRRFVDVVLAEGADAESMQSADFGCTSGLAYRQQAHRFRRSSGGSTGGIDALPDSVEPVHQLSLLVHLRGSLCDCVGIGYHPPDYGVLRQASGTRPGSIIWGFIMDITELLAFTVKNNASDLHLSAGLPPMIRVDGDIHRINVPAVEAKEMSDLIYSTMNDHQRRDFEADLEVDFSYNIPGLARFRVNAFHQDRGTGAVFRVIPNEIWTLEDLQCPPVFRDIIDVPRGLILVTGPTGSGKSTTLAAMVDHLNKNVAGHILTIEDPIEFVHNSKKCLINQREVKKDTHGFTEALRSALREDPDIILVGELRDTETVRLALTAAETGHVVFGTLHTSSAAKTIDRIIDVFPGDEKEMVRSMLSESLRAVIAQTLLKKVGGGRVAAHEIMIATPAIRNLIREDKVAQMYSAIQTGQNVGMTTLDQSLSDLVRRGLVAKPEARRKAVDKQAFA